MEAQAVVAAEAVEMAAVDVGMGGRRKKETPILGIRQARKHSADPAPVTLRRMQAA